MARYVGRHRKQTTPAPVKAVAAAAVVTATTGVSVGAVTAQAANPPKTTTLAVAPVVSPDIDDDVRREFAKPVLDTDQRDHRATDARGITNSLDVTRAGMLRHAARPEDPSSPRITQGAPVLMSEEYREKNKENVENMYRSLDAAVEYAEQVEAERAAEEAAAAAQEAQQFVQAQAEAAAAGGSSSIPVGPIPKTYISGSVALPASGAYTSGFGMRWGAMHNGIDIAAPIGTPIYAAMAGTVIDSGPAQGFGQWIRIRHDDGSITVYGHMQTLGVSVGQRVAAGEYIAGMGSLGFSTGSHLHFEYHPDGVTPVDPAAWLNANGISL